MSKGTKGVAAVSGRTKSKTAQVDAPEIRGLPANDGVVVVNIDGVPMGVPARSMLPREKELTAEEVLQALKLAQGSTSVQADPGLAIACRLVNVVLFQTNTRNSEPQSILHEAALVATALLWIEKRSYVLVEHDSAARTTSIEAIPAASAAEFDSWMNEILVAAVGAEAAKRAEWGRR